MYILRRIISITISILVICSAIGLAIRDNNFSVSTLAVIILGLNGTLEGLSIMWEWSTRPKRNRSPIQHQLFNQGVINRTETRQQMIPMLVGDINTELPLDRSGKSNLNLLLQLSQSHRSFILVGQTGSGKTSILTEILHQIALEYGKSHHFLPFMISLNNIQKSHQILETIASWWHDHYNIDGDVKTFFNNRLIWLMLDGLNELPGDSKDLRRFIKSLQKLLQLYPNLPIIVSCRDIDKTDYESLGLPVVKLEALSNQQIGDYLRSLDYGKELWNLLKVNKPILNLAKNPHVLLLLTDFYDQKRKLPANATQLYEVVIEQRYMEHMKHRFIKIPIAYFLFFMRPFALSTLLYRELNRSPRLIKYLLPREIRNIAYDLQLLKEEDNLISFSHSTFHDYFALQELETLLGSSYRLVISWILLITTAIMLIISFIPFDSLSLLSRSVAEFLDSYSLLLGLILLYTSRFIYDSNIMGVIKEQRENLSGADLKLLNLLLLASSNENEIIRLNATKIIGEMQSSESLPALKARLGDESLLVRKTALESLSKIVHPDVVQIIHSTLHDDSPLIRLSAAYALMLIGDTASIAPLQRLLKDPEVSVAEQAQRSLNQIEDLHHSKWRVRQMTVNIAGQQGKKAIPQLVHALADYDENVQYEAALALARLGRSSIPVLLSQLKDSERQQAASRSLYLIGKKSLPALEDALSDEQFDSEKIKTLIQEIEKK